MRFDLTDLRLFLYVVETGSITRGAERTHLALASASDRIRGMEELLGVRLLERLRRGIKPTPAGQALAHHARLVQQQLERMHGELNDYAHGLKAHIRLLCNTAAIAEFLPDAIACFLAQHRNIDIDLEERPSYQIAQAIAEGFAEIGIVADRIDLSGLQTFPFRTDRLVVIAPRRHALAKRPARQRHVALRDILDEDFVGLSPGSALQDHLQQHAIRAGRAMKLRVRLQSLDAICRLVDQGVGIAIVPETAAQRGLATGRFAILRLSDPWALRHLKICLRDLSALPAHARRLVAHLRQDAPAIA